MSKNGSLFFILVVVCLVGMYACKNSTGEKNGSDHATDRDTGTVVAIVGDVKITLEDFEQQLSMQNPLVRARYKSFDQKKKFLESLVEREAMVQEAKRLKLDKEPEVRQGLNRLLARQFVNKQFNEARIKQIKVTDEQIQQYYQENESRYHVPEKVRVYLIQFKASKENPKVRKPAREKAENTLRKLKENEKDKQAFFRLARELSEDSVTKRIGGDTHYKTRAQFVESYGKAFADAAFSMQNANSLSKVVDDDNGFFIIRFSGKQVAVDFPLERVKGQIRSTLFARARTDAYKSFIDEVKDRVGVKLFEDVVVKAQVETNGSPFDIPRPRRKLGPEAAKPKEPKKPGPEPEALKKAPK